MFLSDYLVDLTTSLNEFAQTGFVLSSDIATNFKSEKVGLIKGSVVFIDGSILFFKEYLDLRYRIDKKTYSFHYQDKMCELRFRYDNAFHKPALGFDEHKHVGSEIISSGIPDLEDVLDEIANMYFAPEFSDDLPVLP